MARQADAERKRIEEAKSVSLTLDPSLPTPVSIKVKDAAASVGKRVKILGWVQFRRSQGPRFLFVPMCS
jgi:asparaginyl-tRNA synthetase